MSSIYKDGEASRLNGRAHSVRLVSYSRFRHAWNTSGLGLPLGSLQLVLSTQTGIEYQSGHVGGGDIALRIWYAGLMSSAMMGEGAQRDSSRRVAALLWRIGRLEACVFCLRKNTL